MKPAAVAVLDVGKTNKKVRLYNRQFEVLAEERTTVQPREMGGLEVEDTETLLSWFRGALKSLACDHDIRAIAITTHGATAALLDEYGRLAHPVISYTAERGADIQDEFFAAFGERRELHRTTCTPDLGFANVAKSMFYIKARMPHIWSHCRHALFYNAYLGYELTGVKGVEPTYLGNHTYLWDFVGKRWSTIARSLGVDSFFPSMLSNPWDSLGPVRPDIAHECGLDPDCRVTVGLHDSNANLVPYLAKSYDNFILNSSGTWCVLMRPALDPILSDEEIDAKVFFNLDVYGRPVRTCIFPAGMEYDTFRDLTSLPDNTNEEILREIIQERELFVIPGVLPDATAFPGAIPGVVHYGGEQTLSSLRKAGDKPLTSLGPQYLAALNISLALATKRSLEHCGARKDTTVFIEGGFANNKAYCALLAALCPDLEFVVTSMKEGTSFGAALSGWMQVDGLSLETIGQEFDMGREKVRPCVCGDLRAYERSFMRLL